MRQKLYSRWVHAGHFIRLKVRFLLFIGGTLVEYRILLGREWFWKRSWKGINNFIPSIKLSWEAQGLSIGTWSRSIYFIEFYGFMNWICWMNCAHLCTRSFRISYSSAEKYCKSSSNGLSSVRASFHPAVRQSRSLGFYEHCYYYWKRPALSCWYLWFKCPDGSSG